MKYKTVFFDFNGVISHDRFYKPLSKSNPAVYEYIQNFIFGPQSEGLIPKWMRGDLNVKDINNKIINETGISEKELVEALVVGGKNFIIENRFYSIIEKLKANKVKVGLVTDNMDIFDLYIKPNFDFEKIFDVVINSFTNRMLKKEGLFDIALKDIGESNFSSTLLIEDSKNSIDYFRSKGGEAYLYTNFEDFDMWAKENLINTII